MSQNERILVIRLGALGDLVLCFQAFHEIRRAYPDARIALLTMPAFEGFARTMPWFDEIIVDQRGSDILSWLHLRRIVRAFKPTGVFDLQGKLRQNILFGLLGGPLGPAWSGSAPLCSHPRLWPPQKGMHFTDFIGAQLRLGRVPSQAPVLLPWLTADLRRFELPDRFVIFIPGCAKGREYKRWPPRSYAVIAESLRAEGVAVYAVGTTADKEAIDEIRKLDPLVHDLSGQTTLSELATLAKKSLSVLGNDTGPTHLAAAVGANVLALMSDRVNPVWSAPKGAHATWLQGRPLETLSPDEVFVALRRLIDKSSAT